MGTKLDGIMGTSPASLVRGLRLGLLQYKIAAIPVRSFDQLLRRRKASVQFEVRPYQDGSLTWMETLALVSLIQVENPTAILEIGTFMGYTARLMAQNMPKAIVHTLDLPLDYKSSADPVTGIPKDDFHLIAARKPGQEFLGTPEQARIRQHFGDSAAWDYTQAAGANCFFIDGSHTYEYCKSDTEKCFELCQGKGLFLWHDCNENHPGVLKFLLEWMAQGREVVRINETNLAYWNSLES